MRKVIYVEGEFYHIYNRGVDKRQIFMEEKDYFRFIHDLYEFNNKEHVLNTNIRFKYGSRTSINRKLIVDIICFCLMPNHFHLILRQVVPHGISLFMQKIGTGYTNYFNEKYKRNGVLFQGKYKCIHINSDNYLVHLSRYQHLNPLDLVQPDWREVGIRDLNQAFNFLNSYRWSSYLDYIGKKNFPSVINQQFLLDFFQGHKRYERFLKEWLAEDMVTLKDIILE